MIRLAWRQFRAPAIVAMVALVVVGAFAAITGPSLAHAYDVALAACTSTGDCASTMRTFALNDSAIRTAFTTLMIVVPVLLGAFWGAPLIAREIEAGTFPLVWTQSVSGSRQNLSRSPTPQEPPPNVTGWPSTGSWRSGRVWPKNRES